MRLEYPEFPSLQAPESRVRKFVEEAKTDFVSASEENDKAWAATARPEEKLRSRPPHEMLLEWRGASLGPRWLSLELHRYWWVGGAHGEDAIFTINYDIKADRFLVLADILPPPPSPAQQPAPPAPPPPGPAQQPAPPSGPPSQTVARLPSAVPALKSVADLARAELLRRFASIPGIAPWIERGTAPTNDNYQYFTFDDKNITIHFARYQVGPGSNGLVDVVLPRRPGP